MRLSNPHKTLTIFRCRDPESNWGHGDFQTRPLSFLTSSNHCNYLKSLHSFFPHFFRFFPVLADFGNSFSHELSHRRLGIGPLYTHVRIFKWPRYSCQKSYLFAPPLILSLTFSEHLNVATAVATKGISKTTGISISSQPIQQNCLKTDKKI